MQRHKSLASSPSLKGGASARQVLVSLCPLITPYTTRVGISPDLLEKLFLIRKWDPEISGPIPLKWPSLLRTKIYPTDEPFIVKEFQKQMIHMFCRMPLFIGGDSVGLGKTIEAIVASVWLKERFPKAKIIVLTTKTCTWQWHDEYERFSLLRPYVMQDTFKGLQSYDARFSQLIKFLEGDSKDVMICKYTSMIGKRRDI